MEISHPRRILAVSAPDSGLLDLVKALTGITPSPIPETLAGTTHILPLQTSYYSAQVPIWLDEIDSPSAWSSDFLAPEAAEVRAALGAFVVCFRKPVDAAELLKAGELLAEVQRVVEGCGFGWDGVCLAVAMPQSRTPFLVRSEGEWEDWGREWGFEVVDFEGRGRNEFSEPRGVERLKEALEANDWEGGDAGGEEITVEDFEDEEGDEEGDGLGFGIETAEMESEMAGMKQAIYGGADNEDDEDGDKEVEKLQEMMLKMQAVRDMGADLPEAERKRFAAKAVSDLMKTL